MKEYPSYVAGLGYKGRGKYCAANLKIGDHRIFRRQPHCPADANAVEILPAADPTMVIGYVPKQHVWIAGALQGHVRLDAIVTDIRCGGWFIWYRARRIWFMVRVISRPYEQKATASFSIGTEA